MVVPVLTAEEYQFTDTGIKLNDDPDTPFVDIESIAGLDSTPIRQSTVQREGTHGAWVDSEYEDARTITIEGKVYAPVDDLDDYLELLKSNYAPTRFPQPFYIGGDNGMRMVFAKSLGLRYAKTTERRLGIVPIQVSLICEDPRLYATTDATSSIPGTLVLAGNRDSVGVITISGGSPTITFGATTMVFTGLTGETLVDLDKRTVSTGGVNARSKMALTGPWPKLQPGSNTFGATGLGGNTASITARSAWR